MTFDELEPLLALHGFAPDPPLLSAHVDRAYTRPTRNNWFVGLYASIRDRPYVNLTLKQYRNGGHIGTEHRFHGIDAVRNDLAAAIADLERLVDQPDLLKCPTCGERWVHLKEGPYGPFLSCDGMQVVGRGPNKDVACRGTSKKITPLIVHG